MSAFSPAECSAMDAALDAAARGLRGANPLVGAALVTPDGQLMAVGHHRGAGTDHAEVDALRVARHSGLTDAEIAELTMVVTLEPCSHTGRTGPCTRAILDAGIRTAVVAVRDPNPVASGGIETLRAAGVDVRVGLRQQESANLNRRWFAAIRERRPFVTLKLAQSLDGCAAAADGTSQWITSEQSRADGHRLRASHDAVVVGTGTALADDPTLTARLPDGSLAPRQPLRAVVGLRDLPDDARIRGTDGRFLHLRTRDPRKALAQLDDAGVHSVLIDGSPRLAAAFLAQDLVDELVVYVAPLILGGRPALPGTDLGIETLTQARRFEPDDAGGGAVTVLGSDVRLRYAPVEETVEKAAASCSPE